MNNDKDARDMADLAFGGSSAVSGDASEPTDAIALLRKYQKLCVEIGRGDSLHRDRIEAAILSLASQASLAKRGTEPSGRLGDNATIRCRKCGEQNTIEFNSARIVTHNPYTGKPRDQRDIDSDPEGKLIVAPGEPLIAAKRGTEPSDERIRAIFLANGFTIKDGQSDLKPYVYAAARALLAESAPSEKLAGAEAAQLFFRAVDRGLEVSPSGPLFQAMLALRAQTVPQVPAGQDAVQHLREAWATLHNLSCDMDVGPIKKQMQLRATATRKFLDGIEKADGTYASLQPEAAGAAQPRDSAGAMASAWFGTSASAAVGRVFVAQPSEREAAREAYKRWPGGHGVDKPNDRFEVFLAGYRAALAARTPTDAGGKAV